mmetsp:Transcript_169025/g.410808  ORF Transcript_169025/g.410808 Transcript_169025/m.410808 type:complete len:250 (+) Transcript_169025:35-784(+)
MAFGKGSKGKKKGQKKKVVDPFTKKEWFQLKAPSMFEKRDLGYTIATRSGQGKYAEDSLRGRVVEVSLGDLKNNAEEDAFRKFKLRVEEVQGDKCLTNFYGMDLTSDKLRSMVRKWCTLIEAHADVKTTDGYVLRIFCIGFTKRQQNMNQSRKTAYAQASQVRNIRKKMVEIIKREAGSVDLKDLVAKLIPEIIGKEITKACNGIYPLHNVHIRKVKTLRSPKLDVSKLLELHGGASTSDKGKKVERSD